MDSMTGTDTPTPSNYSPQDKSLIDIIMQFLTGKLGGASAGPATSPLAAPGPQATPAPMGTPSPSPTPGMDINSLYNRMYPEASPTATPGPTAMGSPNPNMAMMMAKMKLQPYQNQQGSNYGAKRI